jgi:hypothetical protein
MRRIALAALALALSGPAYACADRAERITGVIRSDMRTRNVGEEVGRRLIAELAEAAGHCRAGRNAQGEAIMQRIARTYNYR